MMASTVSGAVFFGSYAADYGFTNVWAYSLVYNFFSIGVDTILCVIVASCRRCSGCFGGCSARRNLFLQLRQQTNPCGMCRGGFVIL